MKYLLIKIKNFLSLFLNCLNPIFQLLILSSLKKPALTGDFSSKYSKKSLQRAIHWLLYEQSCQKDGGITSRISFSFGRLSVEGSYPEVTGYIIETLVDYYQLKKDANVLAAAVKAADFELKTQNRDGSFPGGYVGCLTGSSVFNSAQIILGLAKIYQLTGKEKYRKAAFKAANWIISVQENDGSWMRVNYLGMKRVYDTKVCEALLKLAKLKMNKRYLSSASRNLNFVLANQLENGWFLNADNSYGKNDLPLTHTIGYTVCGLIECFLISKDQKLLLAAQRSLDALLHQCEKGKKILSARFNSRWRPAAKSSCLTGNAQIIIAWLKLYEILGDSRYLNTALKMLDLLKSIQIKSPVEHLDGALMSSFPFWGEYNPYTINSWGVKYFADALMLEIKIKNTLERQLS